MRKEDEELLDYFADVLRNRILPKGDGIPYDWKISYSDDAKRICCRNTYIHINKTDGHETLMPFKAYIPIENLMHFRLTFTDPGANQLYAGEEDYGFGSCSYLKDTIFLALIEHEQDFKNFERELVRPDIHLKEEIILEGMKVLSENRTRTGKEATKLHRYIENKFDDSSSTPKAFLYKLRENADHICELLGVALPIRRWNDFVWAGTLIVSEASLKIPVNDTVLLEKDIHIEQNEYGYAGVDYNAYSNKDSAVVSKTKLYAYGQLIGETQFCGTEKPKFTIYGQGPLQNMLERNFLFINDFNRLCDVPIASVFHEPESKERFPGTERLIDDFKKSGGKEISYTSEKISEHIER